MPARLLSIMLFSLVLAGAPVRAQQAAPEPSAPANPGGAPAPAAPPAPATPPAQSPPAPTPPPAASVAPPQADQAPQPPGIPATVLSPEESEGIIGKSVRSAAGDDMGRIVDIIVTTGAQPRAAVIDFGGFLGVGSRKIAVDWRLLQYSRTGKTWAVTVALARNQLRVSPEYKPGEPVVVLGTPAPAPPPVAAAPAAAPAPTPAPPTSAASAPPVPSAPSAPAGDPPPASPPAPEGSGEAARPPQR